MGISRLSQWYIRTEIRALRERADLSQRELAERLGVSENTIYSWERGIRHMSGAMVEGFCSAVDAPKDNIRYLRSIIKQTKSHGIVDSYSIPSMNVITTTLEHYGECWFYCPVLLAGPLQTKDYYYEFLAKAPQVSNRQIEQLWSMRDKRSKRILHRSSSEIKIVLGSGVLSTLETMDSHKAQLNHILEIAKMPNVDIRVLLQPHYGMQNEIVVVRPGGSPTAGPPFIYLESLDVALYIEDETRIQAYNEAVQEMFSKSVCIEETDYASKNLDEIHS